MAKAKKRSGKKKVKAGRGKPARRVMKKKAAVKRTSKTAPRAAPSATTHTPIAVPGAWPFPMLSKP